VELSPLPDRAQLVEETVEQIREAIERIVSNYDNTRRLTAQDLIDHFIALNTGKNQRRLSADRYVGRVARRRSTGSIRPDISDAERARVQRTVRRGNADPSCGAHQKLQNMVHSNPGILTYFSLSLSLSLSLSVSDLFVDHIWRSKPRPPQTLPALVPKKLIMGNHPAYPRRSAGGGWKRVCTSGRHRSKDRE
jgi:hypothetical protein